MKAKDYSNENTNGEGQDLRLENQIKRGKKCQTPTMTTEKAFKMIDFFDILKLRHSILPNTKDSIQNNKSFITALIASVDVADKKNSIPIASQELLKYTELGVSTASDILLSRELGKLGDYGYDATFRPAFLSEREENKFEQNMSEHSLTVLLHDARTRASLIDSEQIGFTHYMIDQLDLSNMTVPNKKKFLICMIADMS